MYRLITICAVSLLLLGCESPQQIVDRQAAEAREANWQRRYIQDRAESAAAANLQADKAAPNAAAGRAPHESRRGGRGSIARGSITEVTAGSIAARGEPTIR